MREWCDVAYSVLVDSLRGPDEPLHKAVERANDLFLTADELRRKQNKEAFAKLKIPLRPPVRNRDQVVPFQ